MLKRWQDETFELQNLPTDEEIRVFIVSNFTYKLKYLEYLKNWSINRMEKREYLNDEQIKDWFEFYYD